MTDTISADLAKALASAKSGSTTLPKAPDKPAPKAPEAAKVPESPPAPGAKTFLGWVAGSISRKQLLVAVAAAGSLAAGIAAVHYFWPAEEPPAVATATQPVVPEVWPERKPIVPHTGPTLTIEPTKPAETIPPAGLPVPSIVPAATMTDGPGALGGSDPLTKIPMPGAVAAVPPPDSLAVPPVIPAGGPPVSPASTPPPNDPVLPLIPTIGDTGPKAPASLPAAPMNLDPKPKSPVSTDPKEAAPAAPKPPAPVTGRPVTGHSPTDPILPLVPPVGSGPAVPAAPVDLNPSAPTLPDVKPAPMTNTGGSGAKLEFIKPAETGAVTPAAAATRAPTTSYDVDIYHPKGNDTWEAISREYYNDPKFAAALRAYNQNRALTGGTVDVPPLHIVKGYAPQGGLVAPAGRGPVGGDPWNAAGGGGTKIYRVPNGDGMSLPAVAKLVLGNDQRWREIYDLNPEVSPNKVAGGTELKLPADARVQ